MSEVHWASFGAALKRILTAQVAPALLKHIREETYSAQWREAVIEFVQRVEDHASDGPVAHQVALLLQANRETIPDLVTRAQHLAGELPLGHPRGECADEHRR